jgi:hypothetical protein
MNNKMLEQEIKQMNEEAEAAAAAGGGEGENPDEGGDLGF